VLIFVVICRLKCGQRVTAGKILYVNKRQHGRSSSKMSHLKRVHLLFDDDGNAVNVSAEGCTTVQSVKSGKNDGTVERTSNESVEDCLETVSSDVRQNLCGTGNDVINNTAESCSSMLTVDATDECSTRQDNTQLTAAAAESGNCCDELVQETEDNMISDSDAMMSIRCLVASDPDLSKYWWQRYRLFSRFDKGIMIDRGL